MFNSPQNAWLLPIWLGGKNSSTELGLGLAGHRMGCLAIALAAAVVEVLLNSVTGH